MSRKGKRILAGLTAVGAFIAGAALFSTPKHEIFYDARVLPTVCSDGACLGAYVIQIGSTGSERERNVRLELDIPPSAPLTLPFRSQNEGKIRRELTERTTESTRVLELGELESGEWLEVTFALTAPGEPRPAADLVKAIRSDAANGQPGSPTGTRFIRALFQMFDTFFT